MSRFRIAGPLARAALLTVFGLTFPFNATATAKACDASLVESIPKREVRAPSGSAVMERLTKKGGTARDQEVVRHVLSGNVPSFLRQLSPVSIAGTLASGQPVLVTICVMPEYLAVGDDRDFVRVPMGLGAAARIAEAFDFLLPTPRMVDAIYAQARIRVAPSPMKPTSQMSSTAYLVTHNDTVDRQVSQLGKPGAALTAGHKKDLVLSNRLISKPGRVAIYGWHRPNGKPIQPLSTVHGAEYADYSHGVRLVSRIAYVNGEERPLQDILGDKALASVLTGEGPINDVDRLLRGLSRLASN